MDVTDIIDYNVTTLNTKHLDDSFFILSKEDPSVGFHFNALVYAGNVYPRTDGRRTLYDETDNLNVRLCLASHLAWYIRKQLEEEKRFTSTVGISTSKLLSKLVGGLNKPHAQTTLLPPYQHSHDIQGTVLDFIDEFEIGKIPNIGYKSAQKIRELVLQRSAPFKEGILVGKNKDEVSVRQVRTCPNVNAERLDGILRGPGFRQEVGFKTWCLIHGVDNSEVAHARDLPRQISIEDSYLGVNSFGELKHQMTSLAKNLIKRMHLDLVASNTERMNQSPLGPRDEHSNTTNQSNTSRRWLAHPKTLSLATRLNRAQNPDGSRTRTFNRSSRSTPVPNFLFNLHEPVANIAEKLVTESLLPLFRKLHPERSNWNLTIINIAVTGMVECAGDAKESVGRDISKMLLRQQSGEKYAHLMNEKSTELPEPEDPTKNKVRQESDLLKHDDQLHVLESTEATTTDSTKVCKLFGSEADDEQWDQNNEADAYTCDLCGVSMPKFAAVAHCQFHSVDS